MKMRLIKIYYENSEEMYPLSSLEFSPDLLKTLAEMGVITLHQETISSSELRKVKRLLRLKNLLGVNLTGAAIILDLLDRIEALETEIQSLKRR
jgi:MerR family transcriptional regulator/heat shock protein HspR